VAISHASHLEQGINKFQAVHCAFSEHNSFDRFLLVGCSPPVASIRQGWEEKPESQNSFASIRPPANLFVDVAW
jgi:hypothetical protein